MADIERPILTIDSHVVFQLGAELISDVEQALLELVKNAYDGDATSCTIIVEPTWAPQSGDDWFDHLTDGQRGGLNAVGRITVQDNGTGLDEKSVVAGWLTISASLKRSKSGAKIRTGRDRTPVGDKGLGRLATMRLGDVLLLKTMTKSESRSRITSFAWSDFRDGTRLNDVVVKQRSGPALDRRKSGTDVEVLNLSNRSQWDDKAKADSVVAKLTTLISPFRRFKDFRIKFVYDGEPIDLQNIASEALRYASAKFSACWNGDKLELKAWFAPTLFRGKRGNEARLLYERFLSDEAQAAVVSYITSHRFLKNRCPKSLLNQSGGWLYSLEETMTLDDLKGTDRQFSDAENPGPFDAELNYFLFSEETSALLSAAGLSIEGLQNMSRVGIYRDGFRVRVDDDWLNLSQGVTSGGFFQLRPRNVVGFFAITNRDNPLLVEKSDREGFVDNAAWRGFERIALRIRKFSNECLESSRLAYGDFVKSEIPDAPLPAPDLSTSIEESQKQAKSAMDAMERHASILKRSIASSVLGLDRQTSPTSSRQTVEKLKAEVLALYGDLEASIQRAKSVTKSGEASITKLLEEQNTLIERNLRLIDAAAVGLSARTLAHEMASYVRLVERNIRAASKSHKEENELKFSQAVTGVTGALRELKKIVASIDPLLPGSRSIKDTFRTGDGVREFVELRKKRSDQLNVSIEVSGDVGVSVHFSRTRFNQVLENLYQNSLYWLRNREPKLDTKIIRVEINKSTVKWSDNGPGVREAIQDSIFEPYVSDKTGDGQGLGLHIVTAFLRAEKCDIFLAQTRNSMGRRFEFVVNFSGASIRG